MAIAVVFVVVVVEVEMLEPERRVVHSEAPHRSSTAQNGRSNTIEEL